MTNNDYYRILCGENPKDIGSFIADFFRGAPIYNVHISGTLIDLVSPGVRITITAKENSNDAFYMNLLFYVVLNNGEVYYVPFGIDPYGSSDNKYTKEDVLAFLLSSLLNNI